MCLKSSTPAANVATTRPGPTPTVEIATKQNEQVEGDTLFYKDYTIWHMIDRSDRWHAAMVIPNKLGSTLCDAITRTWIQIFGPLKFLIVDGEKGLATEEAEAMLNMYGTEIRPRAPGQHARMIERRGAILRHSLHTAEEHCAREGIEVTMEYLLAEMGFSGNALVSMGGATP